MTEIEMVEAATAQPGVATLSEYAAHLAGSGVRVFPGDDGLFWTSYESGTLMRLPTFHVGPTGAGEVARVLRAAKKAVASYLIEPDAKHPANAFLYVCADPEYALEKLPSAMRRNVRRGLKELTITPFGADELQRHGLEAFCDTRRRTGVSDGTPEGFRAYFAARSHLPEVSYLGAWKGDELAAFLTIVRVDDWAELGCFSRDAFLQYRPNDTLMYSALAQFLGGGECRLVSYGLSSIQAESNAAGLHRFKLKVGFEARPVHRAFVTHPTLRPLANPLTLAAAHTGVKAALRLRPGDRRLKKAGGMLACMRGETWMMAIAAGDATDDE